MKQATNYRSQYTQTAVLSTHKLQFSLHTNCSFHYTQTGVLTTHKLQFTLYPLQSENEKALMFPCMFVYGKILNTFLAVTIYFAWLLDFNSSEELKW